MVNTTAVYAGTDTGLKENAKRIPAQGFWYMSGGYSVIRYGELL